MVIEVPLTRGLVTLIDDEDGPLILPHKWQATESSKTSGLHYAKRTVWDHGRYRTILLHRLLAGAKPGQLVDHIDRNSLNNQRANLRFVTRQQSSLNRGMQKHNTSGFRGITFNKRDQSWYTQISLNGKTTHIGCFRTAEEAAKAYDMAALDYYGEFAQLNFPRPGLPGC